MELPCSERTYFRLRRDIVVQVGVMLGLYWVESEEKLKSVEK